MGYTSARKITNAGTRKSIGKFASLKMKRMVAWESLLERDYIYLLESDKNVIAYYEQPLKVIYELFGKRRTYTPDFMVEKSDKKQIIEVKPKQKAISLKYQEIFQAVSPVCNRNGYEFIVVTDEDIRNQPRLKNLQILYTYARLPVGQEIIDMVEKRTTSIEKVKVSYLAEETNGVRLPEIYWMMYWGYLDFDIEQYVSQETLVSWNIT